MTKLQWGSQCQTGLKFNWLITGFVRKSTDLNTCPKTGLRFSVILNPESK